MQSGSMPTANADGRVSDATLSRPPLNAPHESDWQDVVVALGSDATAGLTDAEVRRRLETDGANALNEAPRTPWWRRLLEQVSSVLILILIAAAAVSALEWWLQSPRETALPFEAIVILAIVVLNAMLGYIQEARAEKAVKALLALSAPEASVIREGHHQRVPARGLVAGDILLVEAGDRIPADARLLEASNLNADEAAMTGESIPVSKRVPALQSAPALGDRINMIYSGTVVTHGRGRAIVTATGMRTEVGRIAKLLAEAHAEPTPLQQELDRTGKRLSSVMLGICAIVFAVGLWTSPVADTSTVCTSFSSRSRLPSRRSPRRCPRS